MDIKIYRISDVRNFFDMISKCRGHVEVVSEDGLHISVNDCGKQENLSLLAVTYTKGIINELHLSVSSPQDAIRIVNYLLGMKADASLTPIR